MPEEEYTDARSGFAMPLTLGRFEVVMIPDGAVPASALPERTLSGKDSREPPQSEEGAKARTEASVSMLRRRRRFEDEAKVRIDALSVNRLLAVAVE